VRPSVTVRLIRLLVVRSTSDQEEPSCVPVIKSDGNP